MTITHSSWIRIIQPQCGYRTHQLCTAPNVASPSIQMPSNQLCFLTKPGRPGPLLCSDFTFLFLHYPSSALLPSGRESHPAQQRGRWYSPSQQHPREMTVMPEDMPTPPACSKHISTTRGIDTAVCPLIYSYRVKPIQGWEWTSRHNRQCTVPLFRFLGFSNGAFSSAATCRLLAPLFHVAL